MQRQLLHIAIYDSVCWNFRPLLLLTATQIAGLPPYKRVLIQSQKTRLSMAALEELQAVSKLHSMFGGSHVRFSAIIFNTFEAAVLLLCLSSQPGYDQALKEEDSHEILGIQISRRSRDEMMKAVETALTRLRTLAEVSEMAASGAKAITQLLSQAGRNAALQTTPTPTGLENGTEWSGTFSTMAGTYDADQDLRRGSGLATLLGTYDSEMSTSAEQTHESLMADLLSNIENQQTDTDLQIPYGFAMP